MVLVRSAGCRTLFESAITYAPSAHSMTKIVLRVTLALAAVFGLGAIWMTIRRETPSAFPFKASVNRGGVRCRNHDFCCAVGIVG